ncbi:MAG: cyclic nucleotide-binding domain-containing protein [Elusimicrobia bacterium]|nr:cyclic nucleotide-binding domain-containing protein [Elusimicrobiota bacterium]
MAGPAPSKLAVDDAAAALLCRALKIEGFFPEFTKDQVRGVFPHGGLNLYPAGYRLINVGEENRDLFAVYAGKVEVMRPFVLKQIYLGPGELFGEMAIVRDGKRNATVVAAVDSQIFHLPYQDLQYLMDKNPSLEAHFKDLAYHRL